MGLADRIREIQTRRASDPVVQMATQAAEDAQRTLERDASDQQVAYKLAEKQRAEQKAALNTSLNALLELVGARKQLEEMRQVWKAGKITRATEEIPDVAALFTEFGSNPPSTEELALPKLPGMALTLRHRFRDVESHTEPPGSRFQHLDYSYWSKRELVLFAVVGFGEDELPYSATLYGSRRTKDTPQFNVFWAGSQTYLSPRPGQNELLGYNPPETIIPNDPQRSSLVLENQLLRIGSDHQSFRDLEDQARFRILHNRDLPGRARFMASPHWYTRLPAHIPGVNLFLR